MAVTISLRDRRVRSRLYAAHAHVTDGRVDVDFDVALLRAASLGPRTAGSGRVWLAVAADGWALSVVDTVFGSRSLWARLILGHGHPWWGCRTCPSDLSRRTRLIGSVAPVIESVAPGTGAEAEGRSQVPGTGCRAGRARGAEARGTKAGPRAPDPRVCHHCRRCRTCCIGPVAPGTGCRSRRAEYGVPGKAGAGRRSRGSKPGVEAGPRGFRLEGLGAVGSPDCVQSSRPR